MNLLTQQLPMIEARDAAATADRRIIHVPRRFVAEEWGGTETVVLECCRQQKLHGWQPEIFTSMALAKQRNEAIRDINVRRFRYCYPFFGLSRSQKGALDKKGGNLLSLSLFFAMLTARNVRLFHAHSLKRLGGMVRTAARLKKKPIVVTLHGNIFDVPAAERSSLTKPIEGKFEWGRPFGALFGSRRVLDDADMIICVGESEYDAAQRTLAHDRISYLPNGVDCAKFASGNGAAFRAKHGIPNDAFVVMNLSRIDEQKNQMLLVEAFAKLSAEHSTAHLVLIGPETQPDYAAQIRSLVNQRGLASRVHLLPGIKNDDRALVDAYHACDVFVLPSRHEPFGIVVLEAWSAGKPVVASFVGGLQSLICDGENGLFIHPDRPNAADDLVMKLLMLSQSRSTRTQLAEAGRCEAAANYDWPQINNRLEAIYQRAEIHAQQRHGRRVS